MGIITGIIDITATIVATTNIMGIITGATITIGEASVSS
jgi:hypothetical protein